MPMGNIGAALVGAAERERETNADRFFKSLAEMKSNLSELAIGRALRDAQTKIGDVKANESDKFKQYQAIRGIGSDLAMKMTQAQASPQSIHSVLGAMETAPTAEEMQAEVHGPIQTKREIDVENVKHKNRMEELGIKAQQKADAEKLQSGILNNVKGFDQILVTANELKKKVTSKADPDTGVNPQYSKYMGWQNLGGLLPAVRAKIDPDFKPFQQDTEALFQELRKNLAGTRANRAEMARVERMVPSLGDQPKSFLAGLDNVIQGTQAQRQQYIKEVQAGGWKKAGNLIGTAPTVDSVGDSFDGPAATSTPAATGPATPDQFFIKR